MNRNEQIRAKADVSTTAFRNTVAPYYNGIGYDIEETTFGGEEDVNNLTDYFVFLEEGKIFEWRGQHKHTSNLKGPLEVAVIRYQRSSGRSTDYQKLQSLPYKILEKLVFTFTQGDQHQFGAPFMLVSASSLLEWIRDKHHNPDDYVGKRLRDDDGAWSDFLYIPAAELSEVQQHKNYVESF